MMGLICLNSQVWWRCMLLTSLFLSFTSCFIENSPQESISREKRKANSRKHNKALLYLEHAYQSAFLDLFADLSDGWERLGQTGNDGPSEISDFCADYNPFEEALKSAYSGKLEGVTD